MDDVLRSNRTLWDTWTGINAASSFCGVDPFRDGRRPIRLSDDERLSKQRPPWAPTTGPFATVRAAPTACIIAKGSDRSHHDPCATGGTVMRRGRWLGAVFMAVALAACQTATVLQDGRVLLITPTSAALYDPATGAIIPAGAPGVPRAMHSATLLGDGQVLLAGGATDTGVLDSAELFDPITGTFTATGSMVDGRSLQSATLLPDGRVLLAGGGQVGGDDAPPPLVTAELYDPATGTFAATGAMSSPRAMHTATLLPDGQVLIAGGGDGDTPLGTAERYDVSSGSFTPTGSLGTARAVHTATLLGDGSVLVVGGLAQSATPDESGETATTLLDSVERYDPATGTFSPAGTLLVARGGHTATLLPDGRLLITGGVDPDGAAIGSAELFDPATGTSTATGDMVKARGLHTASLLPNGQVLLVGGELGETPTEGADPVGSPEVYDPATGTFRPLTQ
jgi:large repetitive protein